MKTYKVLPRLILLESKIISYIVIENFVTLVNFNIKINEEIIPRIDFRCSGLVCFDFVIKTLNAVICFTWTIETFFKKKTSSRQWSGSPIILNRSFAVTKEDSCKYLEFIQIVSIIHSKV